MPLPTPPLVAHCSELLASLGAVRARRMFGGWGFYADDTFVALLAAEQLYLKTDAATQHAFAAAGGAPFQFVSRGKTMTTHYWSAPPDALESPAAMAPWARLALQAAFAAPAARQPRPAARPASAARATSRAATSAQKARKPRG